MRTKQSERTAKIADSIAQSDMRVIAHTVAQPVPFRVNRTKHDRMNDPSVTVANLNRSEVNNMKDVLDEKYRQVNIFKEVKQYETL
jgi:K+/H+ antiporter YhaU regulatory subunit KhtT